jgi:FkbM family methyltransferase
LPSQHAQDHLVLELLGGLRGGFFLDSGAADGVVASNTLLLETHYGWRGICVEPDSTFFAALVRSRTSQCVNCCLYDRDGRVDFVQASYLSGIREAYEPRHFRLVTQIYGDDLRTALRPARTIRSVLRECNAPPVIDYWSLDTEGSELTILRSFPFDEYAFRVLTVEHNRGPLQEEIRRFLESRGYSRFRTLDIDDCYVWGRVTPRPSWRSRVRSLSRR